MHLVLSVPVPAECVDLTQMKSYLVTADSITAHTATGTDITVNNFVIPYTGNVGGSITVSITMPTNGTLVSAKFTGDFTTATIEVVVNNVSAMVKVNGVSKEKCMAKYIYIYIKLNKPEIISHFNLPEFLYDTNGAFVFEAMQHNKEM